jgi:hypothetical protein
MGVFTRENNVKSTHMFLSDIHLFSSLLPSSFFFELDDSLPSVRLADLPIATDFSTPLFCDFTTTTLPHSKHNLSTQTP